MWTARLKKLVDSLTGANNVLLSYVNVEDSGTGRTQAGTSGENSGTDGGSH